MEYLHNHYYISTEKYTQYATRCGIKPETSDCKEIIRQIENTFVKTGSDMQNLYKECIQQMGPERYKCLDTVGILAFMNDKAVR